MADKKVKILYFAILREQRGVDSEMILTSANTVAELYEEVARRHGLGLNRQELRAAVNKEFVEWTAPVREGDEIVFIPPSSGG